jgi:hypothetical protein
MVDAVIESNKLHTITRLREIAKELKDKAQNAAYEAQSMERDVYEIDEIADYLQSGDIASALDLASSISFDRYDICHLDFSELEGSLNELENIETTIEDNFQAEE